MLQWKGQIKKRKSSQTPSETSWCLCSSATICQLIRKHPCILACYSAPLSENMRNINSPIQRQCISMIQQCKTGAAWDYSCSAVLQPLLTARELGKPEQDAAGQRTCTRAIIMVARRTGTTIETEEDCSCHSQAGQFLSSILAWIHHQKSLQAYTKFPEEMSMTTYEPWWVRAIFWF